MSTTYESVSTKQTLLLDLNDTGDLILGAFRYLFLFLNIEMASLNLIYLLILI
jgi:hypothetical protein